MNNDLENYLNAEQLALFESLNTPADIQAYLDRIPYSPENNNRSPASVLRDGVAHCLDGGLFAAAALQRIGFGAFIIDLLPEPGTDDDHVLAIYKHYGHFGAIAKSNFSGLRFREPIYRSLRELSLSYFPMYFNSRAEKTLRAYTRPLNLKTFDHLGWMWRDAVADLIEQEFHKLRSFPLLKDEMITGLSAVDSRTYEAGLLGADKSGLYKPSGLNIEGGV
jgi:hypothetical protein